MFLLIFLAALVWAVWVMCMSVVAVVLFCVEMIVAGLAALNERVDEKSTL